MKTVQINPNASNKSASVNAPAGRVVKPRRFQEINAPTTPIKKHVHHIAVAADAVPAKEKPLSAYMVPSQYLSRDVIARVAPKRPLGQPPVRPVEEPVKFYSQIAAMPQPTRIRRPRSPWTASGVAEIADTVSDDQPVEPAYEQVWGQSVSSGDWQTKIKQLMRKFGSALLASVGVISTKTTAAVSRVYDSVMQLIGARRVQYSANRGAQTKPVSLTDNRIRLGIAAAILIVVFSFGVFGSLVNDSKQSGSSANKDAEGANGVTTSQQANDNSAGVATPGGNNPQSAQTPASPQGGQSTAGTTPWPAGVAAPTGGRGGSAPAPTAPSGASDTPAPAPAPAPTPAPVVAPPPPSPLPEVELPLPPITPPALPEVPPTEEILNTEELKG